MTKLEIAIKLRDQDDCALSHKTTTDVIREYISECENTFEQGETVLVNQCDDKHGTIEATFCCYNKGEKRPYVVAVKDDKLRVWYSGWKYAWKKKTYIPYTDFDNDWVNKKVKGKSTCTVYTIVGKYSENDDDMIAIRTKGNRCYNVSKYDFLKCYEWLEDNSPCGKIK